MQTLDLLKELSEATGPSGYEGPVRARLEALWEPLVDALHSDALGNLIAYKRGNSTAETRPTLMAAAHMDEIALMVTDIEEGFLRVTPIGGVDRRALLGQAVIVHGKAPLPGIIGTRPPHVLSEEDRKKTVPWEQIFVDVGLPAAAVADQMHVGDVITLDRSLIALKNDLVAGKALDNRASVAALTLALEALAQREHLWDFYAVATVQEEMGLKGAITSAYGVHPDVAIAIDATFGQQHNQNGPGTFELDKGPTIGLGPNFHPHIVARLKETAKRHEIPYHIEPLPRSSGTDAWGIQVAREGIPTGLLSIPVRYMHQPVETLALRDVERTARLLTAYVAELGAEDMPRWEDEL